MRFVASQGFHSAVAHARIPSMIGSPLLAVLPAWCGDLHAVCPPHWSGIIITLVSILCGGLIGIERERSEKPAGMRTLILICLGSAIFTQASILIALGGGDRGRIAAQIVTGIGFLGAGAIIRERGTVIGVTTGATIWATAAVGVVIGTGYAVAGVVFSLLILGTLTIARGFERMARGPCRAGVIEITFRHRNGKTRVLIEDIIREHLPVKSIEFSEPSGETQTVRLQCCRSHRLHRSYLTQLATLKNVVAIVERS